VRQYAHRIADVDDAWTDHPRVQGDLATEHGANSAQDIEVLLSVVGIDGGDDAPLPHRVKANDCGADGERLPGQPWLYRRGNSGHDEVGAQPADIHAEAAYGAVRSDEQVQDVETLGRGVGDQPRIRARSAAYDVSRLGRVPSVTVHQRHSIRTGGSPQTEQVMPGPPGEQTAPTGDMDDPVSFDSVRGEVS